MSDKNEIMQTLGSALGMTPLNREDVIDEGDTHQVFEKVPSKTILSDIDAGDDYEFARNNIRTMIERATSSLDTLFLLAQASESPRAFEVYTKMLDTVKDMNMELLDLQKKKFEVESMTAPAAEETKTIEKNNTNVFIGTTAGLLDLIEARKKVIEHEDEE